MILITIFDFKHSTKSIVTDYEGILRKCGLEDEVNFMFSTRGDDIFLIIHSQTSRLEIRIFENGVDCLTDTDKEFFEKNLKKERHSDQTYKLTTPVVSSLLPFHMVPLNEVIVVLQSFFNDKTEISLKSIENQPGEVTLSIFTKDSNEVVVNGFIRFKLFGPGIDLTIKSFDSFVEAYRTRCI